MRRTSVPALKRAVTRLVHESITMAKFQADFDEGQASASDMQWQQANLHRAQNIYNRRLTLLADELKEKHGRKHG